MIDSRTKRQYDALDKWEASGYKGTLEATTGFGKTYMSMLAIQGMIWKQNITSVTIIVPTIDLKTQWEEELAKNNIDIAQVFVVNTASKYWDVIGCDLLIIDEYHTVASRHFRKVLDINHKYLLTLTATVTRTDGLHTYLLERAPIFDTIGLQECLDNEWISEFVIYNIPVEMPKIDMMVYKEHDKKFRQLATNISGINEANYFLNSGNKKKAGQAARYYKYLRLRKDVCKNNSNKHAIVERIVDCFPDVYGIIFNPSIDFAKQVEVDLGDKCLAYHSKISKKKREQIITKFKDESTSVRLLSTVSTLDAGFNHPKSSLGIITSGNSSQLTNIQRTGRLVRKHPNKQGVIVNLYSPDTQEVAWLESRLKGVKVVNITIEEFEALYKQ